MTPKTSLPNRQSLDLGKRAGWGMISVLLPDMFVSFLARKPRINPHYATVKAESEAWMVRSVSPIADVGWKNFSR